MIVNTPEESKQSMSVFAQLAIAFGLVGFVVFVGFLLPPGLFAPPKPSPEQIREQKTTEFVIGCQKLIERQLKAPSTAVFADILERNSSIDFSADPKWVLRSYVDAENSFGATLRSKYTCVLISNTGVITARLGN
jgi:hypothetical protein